MPDNEEVLLARMAMHYKLLSQEQAQAALTALHAPSEKRSLGQLLVAMGFLNEEQHKALQDAFGRYLAQQQQQKGASIAPSGSTSGQSSPGEITEILKRALEAHASDIHIHAGAPVQFRRHGRLLPVQKNILSAADSERLLLSVMDAEQQKAFKAQWELDFAFSIPGLGRFRANVYKQQRGLDGVFRMIPSRPPTLDDLRLPPVLRKLTNYHQGLVLVTGPSGCGKSSTLAALVNVINEERGDHILTVEDPIEFLHPPKKAVINQRQSHKHTQSFATALRAALREDPDVIVIGELRDLETTALAISAAETGHLVLATLHTNSAIRTIHRILDVFPHNQQAQIRAMVSESLRAIVTQKLVPTVDGEARVPATEILMVRPAVSALIRDEKTHQIRSLMQTGKADGMCLLDDSLAEWVKQGVVSVEEAARHAEDPRRFSGQGEARFYGPTG